MSPRDQDVLGQLWVQYPGLAIQLPIQVGRMFWPGPKLCRSEEISQAEVKQNNA